MTLYVVDDGHRKRLIEAKTRAGARSFAAKDLIKVVKASSFDSHELAVKGIKIESALEEDDK
jgi:hypothetical protein